MCYVERLGVPSSTRPTSQIGQDRRVHTEEQDFLFSKQIAAHCFPGCRFGDDNGRSSAVVDWAALGRRMSTQVGRARCLSKATAGPASKTIRVLAIMKFGDAVCWCGFRAG